MMPRIRSRGDSHIRHLRAAPAIAAMLVLGLSLAPDARTAEPPRLAVGTTTTPQLCADVLRRLTGVTRPIRNTLHTDHQAFVLSKPQIEPLETQQYLQYEDEGRTRPTMLMRKGKSADHIVDVYGAGAARTDLATTCRDVNRDLVLGAWTALTPAERAAARATPQRIMLDADDVKLTGSRWITPHRFAWTGEDGRPHLQARRLRADWTDWRWRFMPDIFRGTFYCQLASPEYLRRLFLGEAVPPPRAAAD